MNIWDSVHRSLERASKEAARMARIRHLRSTIDRVRQDINQQSAGLVSKAQELYDRGVLIQSELLSFCQALQSLQQQLAEAQRELQSLQSSSSATTSGPQEGVTTYPVPDASDLPPYASSALVHERGPEYPPTIAVPPPPPAATPAEYPPTIAVPPPPPAATPAGYPPTIAVPPPPPPFVRDSGGTERGTDQQRCPRCGSLVEASALHCTSCGYFLRGESGEQDQTQLMGSHSSAGTFEISEAETIFQPPAQQQTEQAPISPDTPPSAAPSPHSPGKEEQQ